MVDRVADDELIVNEALEDAAINFEDLIDEESDEESLLSDDSACDCSESVNDIVQRAVPFPEIHRLNLHTEHCLIEFYYYSVEHIGVCASCMIRLFHNEIEVIAVRNHETASLGALNGQYCSNCAMPLFTCMPTNMCPICVPQQ